MVDVTLTLSGTPVTLAESLVTTVTVEYGTAITAMPVVITATGTAPVIKADASAEPTTTRTSGASFNFDFSTGMLNIAVTDGEESKVYSLKVAVAPETVARPAQIFKVGWYSARAIEDDFDSFDNAEGAVAVEVGPFKPKYVVNINITGGPFTSYFDLATNKLYVFKGTSKATKADLANSKYQLILME